MYDVVVVGGGPAGIGHLVPQQYTAQAAMEIYGTEPERALVIIDSAQILGSVNPFLADFLPARHAQTRPETV